MSAPLRRRVRRTQLALYAAGDDLPLFAGTPAQVGALEPAAELEPARPAEAETLALFSHETIDIVSE